MQTLKDYIEANHGGNASEFARSQGVHRQQVKKWLDKGYTVANGCLYKEQRQLIIHDNVNQNGLQDKTPAL